MATPAVLNGPQILSTGYDEELRHMYNNDHVFTKYKHLIPVISILFAMRIKRNNLSANVIEAFLNDCVENGYTDTMIYKKLWSLIHNKKYNNFAAYWSNPNISLWRAKNRYDEIMTALSSISIDLVSRYKEIYWLDLGSGVGDFPYYLMTQTNLPVRVTFNDIRFPEPKYYIGYPIVNDVSLLPNIPLFNVITALMTLHHIKNFEQLLKESIDRLEENGYLIVRDHDAYSDDIKICLDVIDKLYKFSLYDPPEVARFTISLDSISFFHSVDYFVKIITDMGLTHILTKRVDACLQYYKESKQTELSYNNSYFMVFQKAPIR